LVFRQEDASTAWRWNVLPALVDGTVYTSVATPLALAVALPNWRNGPPSPIGMPPQLPSCRTLVPRTRLD
jgi:hypothetical protein